LNLIIEKLVYGGDGLARLPADEHGNGKGVFVPFVLPGEHVEATLVDEKPGFVRARMQKVVLQSARRVQPLCPYFQRCGGCHYQHTSYEYQLEMKASILKENLRRIAKLELNLELGIHPSPPWNYRNRSRLKIQTVPEFALGYFKFNSHELLPVEECPISSPLINRAIAAFWEWGRAGQRTHGLDEVEFFADAEDSQLLVELYGGPDLAAPGQQLAEELRATLPQVAGVVVFENSSPFPSPQKSGQPRQTGVSGATTLVYHTERAAYRVSAGAFFQVNRHLVGELVGLVSDGRAGTVALDLYAGTGLFSSILSRGFAQVIAVESSQISYADLVHNSPANVKTVRATSEQYLQKASGKVRADLVVIDPPRSGLGTSVLNSLAEWGAPRLIYVSCDPATLARDLGRLLAAGYRVEQAHLVDLFPQTYHLESVFHLAR
jgi:23S rRNA (uracil1939-C5)-methyltransferase